MEWCHAAHDRATARQATDKDIPMAIYSEMTELALSPAQDRSAGWSKPAKSTAQDDCPVNEVFAEALRDDSNQELDWLWVYVQVTREDQRRYCLERALVINPKSELALRELAQLRSGRRIEYGVRS
jgi:hypothetical protein